MFINIEEIRDKEIVSKTEDFETKGGGLIFRFFRIAENYSGKMPTDKYDCHLVVARQIMERINFEMNFHWNRAATKGNRKSLPIYQTNFDMLDDSGVEIKLKEFLGPYYDLERDKPIVRGVKGNDTCNSYFYFDEDEEVKIKIDIQSIINDYQKKFSYSNGFVYAFMEPPYSIATGKTIKEKGEYLIEFINYFFSNLNQIEIMKWSTDCSPFFDSGKEWWGTYFWTVYNPKKDWYIGICGSETD